MFEFFTTIFTKITTVIAGAIITIGIVSMPIEEPYQIDKTNEQNIATTNISKDTKRLDQQLNKEIKLLKREIDELKNKPTQPKIIEKSINTEEPTELKTENIELKIATCKATKQSSYDDALLKLDQATDTRLKEIFNSLNQQYENAATEVFAKADANISRIKNDSVLSGESKISLIKQYNDDATAEAEQLYQNQQTFWENQKVEIENTKQDSINKLNAFLSEEYTKCLKQ